MSSHHTIRDNQEPAIYFADPNQVEKFLDFLEWGPLVIANEKSRSILRENQVFVDQFVNSVEELFDFLKLKNQEGVHIIGDLDDTVFEKAHASNIYPDIFFDKTHKIFVQNEFAKWYPAQTELAAKGSAPVFIKNMERSNYTTLNNGLILITSTVPFILTENWP